MKDPVMVDLDRHMADQDAYEKLELWDEENAPVFQMQNGCYYDRKTHRIINGYIGAKLVKEQDRAREEFLNPTPERDQ